MSVPSRQPLHADQLEYVLPSDRVATRPAEPRDSARMLVMWRSSERLEHRLVRDLPEYLQPGDALVFNTTSVIPARFFSRRETGGTVEGLFLARGPESRPAGTWQVLLKSQGRLGPGQVLRLLDRTGSVSPWMMRLEERRGSEWTVLVQTEGGLASADALHVLGEIGLTPLPPYIIRARAESTPADDIDRAWYQTIYADPARQGSVAAPTAGLHFTQDLLNRLQHRGIKRMDITLHVGPGTFKPVSAATLAEHQMHTERFEIDGPTVRAIIEQSRGHGRIIAIGTTSVRALESLPDPLHDCSGSADFWGGFSGMTDLLIAPPHHFRLVDGLLTNFHLPRSTLLALVAAMVGLERLKQVYQQAIDLQYRFYSYGDAMLILP